MASTRFREMVAAFPPPDEKFRAKPSTGLSYVEASSPTFVEPNLEIVTPIEAERTSVILLSAPGAVGKSTMAAELAFRTGGLLWDLSKFQVGSKTFSGTILDAYGNMATGVLKRFKEGNFFFVLDALDEAQVRAGSQNFDAFLDDLVATLKDPRPKPTLALLARTDTADWINAVLDDQGVPIARYQIEYFDQREAFEFIERQLDSRRGDDGKQPLHRQQAKSYSEAREALFALIYKLFSTSEDAAWTDQRVKDFLGYAPVLEALTDYLDVSNYMHFRQDLSEEPIDGRDPWQFLTDVLIRLLTREHKKIVDAVRGMLGAPAKAAGWSDWQRLYGTDEQLSRVLAYSMRIAPGVTTALPASMDANYEEAIKTSLPNHPFLSGKRFANVVFKEFTYAWGLTRGSSQLSDALREAMKHREEPFLPSQLFSRFLITPGKEQPAVIDGQDFGVLCESLQSRAQKLLLSLAHVGDTIHASLGLDPETDVSLEIHLLDSGAGVSLWRRLANADIDIDAPVRLGLPEQRFTLGPSVDLRCTQLTVACDDMDVDAADGVIIRAASYSSGAASLRLRVRNEAGGLAVVWPGVAHPWAAYRTTEAAGPLRLGETMRGDTLRKFILMFRRQRNRREDTLMGARWSPNQLGERDRLLALSLKRGVLERIEGPRCYSLNLDYVSLVSLVLGKPQGLSSGARKFVSEYLGDEADRLLG